MSIYTQFSESVWQYEISDYLYVMKEKIIKQISTHKAVKENGKINIYTKGLNIPVGYKYPDGSIEDEGFVIEPEFLYSIPAENEDDLFAIFERYEEDNRCNLAELNSTLI